MNAKILIPIVVVIGIVVIASFVAFLNTESQSEPDSVYTPSYEIDFAYSDMDKIRDVLTTKNIFMSPSTDIADHTVDQYCTFFDDENIQNFVEYCITTALVSSDGTPIGNFNMGGSTGVSVMALAIVESSNLLDSRDDRIDFIFETMVEKLVCDCWSERQPGGFGSVQSWLDAAEKRYLDSGEAALKSKIDGLDEKQIILEITSTEKSYLWTFIVVK